MRLKEIKPGMVIHCKNDEEKKALLEEAERLGYMWANGYKPTEFSFPSNSLVFREDGLSKRITWSVDGNKNTEFSDLILPELTAEEALLAYDQMRKENYCCNDCQIYGILGNECTHKMEGHISEIMDAIKQWKSEHEKKEPEIETEWFWQGKIFKISEDGSYHHIKDGTGIYDTGCEFRESAEEYMEDELKEYCKTHDGKFIAVVDHVCRVKAVE